jgi:hypothetical protein
MKAFGRNLAITGVIVGLLCAAAPAGAATSATVNVRITVLPYAKVSFNQESVQVDKDHPGTVTGTFTCNAPVNITGDIRDPSGNGILWAVNPTDAKTTAGVHSIPWTVTTTANSSRTVYFIRAGETIPGNPSDGVVTVTLTITTE